MEAQNPYSCQTVFGEAEVILIILQIWYVAIYFADMV